MKPSPALQEAPLPRRSLPLPPMAVAGALLITLLFWAILPAGLRGNTNSDFDTFYEPVARSLLAGDGLTTAEGRPAMRYPPGYPALIAMVFAVAGAFAIPEPLALAGFTLLCVGLSAALVYALARMLWRPQVAALITIAWASYPPTLWSTKQPNSETPFTLCFYAAVLLFWYAYTRRERPWPLLLVAGALVGLSMLIRPLALSIPPAMALFLLLGRRHRGAFARAGLAAAFLAGCLAPVLPWQAWMYAQSGRVHLLSSGGPSSMRDGLTFAVDRRDRRSGYSAPPDVVAVMERLRERGGEMRSFGAVARIVGEELRRDPLPTLKLLGIKALRSLYAMDSERFELPSILMQCVYLGAIGLGLRAAWRRGDELRDYALLMLLLLLCFWGVTFLVLSILRYTAPMIALALTILPAMLPPAWTRPIVAPPGHEAR